MPLRRLALKQFRDADEPDRACYQALVRDLWTLSTPWSAEELEPVTIRIYRYPSLPLVKTLGLQTTGICLPQEMQGAIADELKPEKPFRIKARLEVGLGEVIAHTADRQAWSEAPPYEKSRHHVEKPTSEGFQIDREVHELWENEKGKRGKHGLQPLIQALFNQRAGPPRAKAAGAGGKKE